MFVPSLSWQTDCFYTESGHKVPFSYLARNLEVVVHCATEYRPEYSTEYRPAQHSTAQHRVQVREVRPEYRSNSGQQVPGEATLLINIYIYIYHIINQYISLWGKLKLDLLCHASNLELNMNSGVLTNLTTCGLNENAALFLSAFPLCMSRACLGELIVCSTNRWRKRCAVRFLILPHVAQVWGLRVRCQALQENGSFLFECLPSLFVPSLSWQKDIIFSH
jgi:hypothetical protein